MTSFPCILAWLALLLPLAIQPSAIQAQPYAEEKTRHRFAQTYLGVNALFVPSGGQLFSEGQGQAFPALFVPRITLGGLHFWGKLDFNMSFSLAHLGDRQLGEDRELLFRPGGDFSARYYPWRLLDNRLRPFVGVSFKQLILGIRQQDREHRTDYLGRLCGLGGLSFVRKGWQLTAELMWLPGRELSFYPDRKQARTYQLPPLYASFGVVKYFDTTLKEEADFRSGRAQAIEGRLRAAGKLNSFSLGVAPSATYFFKAPAYETGERASVPRHKANTTLDLGLGYLLHDAGLHLGVSYRDYTSDVESYGLNHLIRRQSLALEGYKFLWNYNGFVPFIGPSISLERWGVAEFEGNTQLGEVVRTRMISPGIIFGWDIATSPLDTWVLRTNLRYYPFQRITDLEGNKVRVDQFEFNFIQLVIYPNRLLHVPRARKRY